MTKEEITRIRRNYHDNIPDLHNGAYRKVWKRAIEKRSLAAAVKAKCLDCCCWVAAEIKDCRVPGCPLYELRPYADHPKRPRRQKEVVDSTASLPENSVEGH